MAGQVHESTQFEEVMSLVHRARRVASRAVGSMGAGDHVLPFSEQPNLPAGIYLIRLTQSRRALISKAAVVK